MAKVKWYFYYTNLLYPAIEFSFFGSQLVQIYGWWFVALFICYISLVELININLVLAKIGKSYTKIVKINEYKRFWQSLV
jgi:hypothetical protein